MAPRISGIVTDRATGSPMAGVLLTLFLDRALLGAAQTDRQGRFALEVPGDTNLRASSRSPRANVRFTAATRLGEVLRVAAEWKAGRRGSSEMRVRLTADSPRGASPVRHVRGTVQTAGGAPAPRLTVSAEDVASSGAPLVLGRAVTNDSGGYVIEYSAEILVPLQRTAFDLRVVVTDGDASRALRAVSEVVSAAPPEALIDVVLPAGRSEFEELSLALAPALKGRALYDVEQGALADLATRTRVPRNRLTELWSAARLGHEIGLSATVLFGLLRSGVPANLDEVLALSEERLRAVLDKAPAAGWIPEMEPGAVDEAVASLRRLRAARTPLVQLAEAVDLDPAHPIFAALERRNIRTLDDLRAAGGVALMPESEISPDDPALAKLEAHARLMTLQPNTAANERLIAAGYSSIGAVARAASDEIRRALGDSASADGAAALHRTAKLQDAFIHDVGLGFAGQQATGYLNTIEDWRTEHPIYQILSATCGCEDCAAAVSPQAYLADLMQYALDHLRDNGQKIDLNFFKDNFHQPFSDLPATCEASQAKVRQVRICVEVLRSYLGARPLAPAARENALKLVEQEYRLGAYQRILEKLGTTFTEIRLARGAAPEDRGKLAERIGVSETNLDALFIDPSALSESALESLFGLGDTTQPPLRVTATPSIRLWRQAWLRRLWSTQDWPADDFAERRQPIIDPDVLGPDDFREPVRRTGAGALEKAFDLWVARRSWADAYLAALRAVTPRQTATASGPDFSATVAALGAQPYRTHTWTWPGGALATLRDKLEAMTAANAEATAADLAQNFHIDVDAARRIVELWEKDAAFWQAPTRAPRVAPEEWEEVYSILLAVRKREARAFWIQEEVDSVLQRAQANELERTWVQNADASQALLGPREFWPPLRIPAEGDWPPIRSAGQPLIDPGLVPRADLPDPTAGARALALWDQRRAVLDQKTTDLEDELSTSGADDMLTLALGTITAPATSWSASLRALNADISGTDATRADAARQVVEQQLRLTVEGVQKTVRVLDLAAAGGTAPLPSKADWAEIFSILTRAWALRTQYATWLAEEQDPNTGVEPWRCAKHALTRWRTSPEARAQWREILESRSATPLIDPDVLASSGYLETPGTGDAWTLWEQRRTAIASKLQTLGGTARTAVAFTQATDTELGPGALAELSAAKKSGAVLSPRLRQLNLTSEGLDQLVRIRDLLGAPAPQPVLDSEWQSACSILTQVWKQRRFGEWRLAERARGITLSPDLFQDLPVDLTQFPPPPPPATDPWRFNADALLTWRDRLQSRISQEEEVLAALDDAVGDVEEQTLPALRDGLILAADPMGLSDTPAGRKLGDRLAIATEYSGCQTTTRITQAIETFQIVLWSVRMGTLLDVYPNLQLAAPDFDREWPWIGTYPAWRAAMFVFLYPENIMLPSLRPAQSPAFRALVDDLRGVRNLTPARAREAAEGYAAHLRDLCTLDVQATCSGLTSTATGDRMFAYGFGVGPSTGTVYWSFADPADTSGYVPAFWGPVPGLEGKSATVVGADSYDGLSERRHVYVFFKMESEGKELLGFNRYDLRSCTWQSDVTTLKLPDGIRTFKAVLRQRGKTTESPRIAIQLPDGLFYERALDALGVDWEPGDWIPRDRLWTPWQSVDPAILGGVRLIPGARLFATHANDRDLVHVVAPGQDGQVHALFWNGLLQTPAWTQETVPALPGGLPANGHVAGVYRVGPKDVVLAPGAAATQMTLPLIDVFTVNQGGLLHTIQRNSFEKWAGQWTSIAQPWGAPVKSGSANPIVRSPAAIDVLVWLGVIPALTLFSSTYMNQWGWVHSSGVDTNYVVDPTTSFDDEPTSGFVAFLRSPGRIELVRTHLSVVSDDFWKFSATTNPAALAEATPRLLPDTSGIGKAAPLSAVARDNSHFDIFASKASGEVWTVRWSRDEGWAKWDRIGTGSTRFDQATPISAIAWASDHVVLVAADRDGVIQTAWQRDEIDESPWHPWAPVEAPTAPLAARAGFVSIARAEASMLFPSLLRLFSIGQDGLLYWTESLEQLPWRPVSGFGGHPSLWPDPKNPQANVGASDLQITELLTPEQRTDRRAWIGSAFTANAFSGRTANACLEEAFYSVPIHLALQLQKSGAYVAALDWLRLVYDYTLPAAQRTLVGRPPAAPATTGAYARDIATWLLDPLNPHSIAATRSHADVRFVLLSIIRCVLDYADAEFTADSSESVPRARELYELALELLDADELRLKKGICEDVIGSLTIAVDDAHWVWVSAAVKSALAKIADLDQLKAAARKIEAAMAGSADLAAKYRVIRTILSGADGRDGQATVARRLEASRLRAPRLESAVLARPGLAGGLDKAAAASYAATGSPNNGTTPAGGHIGHVPQTVFDFCIPPNPLPKSLRLRANLNLYKLRNCRNIAGLSRELEPFAAPTDTTTGMPSIGAGGQLVVPGVATPTPTLYRYSFLIERAKQLAQQAMQVESSFLAALEKSDKEAYDLMTARANVRLTQAGVRLQDLRAAEAADGVRASELQRDRATLQQKTYAQWISAGLSPSELALLGWYDWVAVFQIIAVNLGALMQGITGGIQIGAYTGPFGAGFQAAYQSANALKGISESLAINAQREISRLSVLISHERSVQEWSLQKSLADQDIRIGEQQILLAQDRVRIVEQERTIEQMKADQAREVLEFLANKFTNKDLYDWMSGVLERVYSFFLQQATAAAQLAAQQLGFERQETPPRYIQDDYWEPPTDDAGSAGQGAQAPDRRGLTGSARLLQDITQLDQYAVDTRQRKQQLTRTFSLAQLAPFEFQQFQETGVLPFATPMELFDRDFPGHYLRLIQRVRTTVIALIPPTQGIRATLTSSGISRVTIGGDLFQTVVLRRPPEVVALSAAYNASGLFELQDSPELRAPFEGSGVATTWELSMPKAANPFDYSTVADVLVTIEYTALNSFDYRQQIVQSLNSRRTASASRAFCFRYQFADAWYDLHNPDTTPTPMAVQFETSAADFPPNVDAVRIEHVELYFVRRSGSKLEFETVELRLDRPDGPSPKGTCGTEAGLITTRTARGTPWLVFRDVVPVGRWTLTLPDSEEARRRFTDADVTDIVLIITFGGRLPEWPI